MKRPVTLVLVASLLASASAFAGNGARNEVAQRMAEKRAGSCSSPSAPRSFFAAVTTARQEPVDACVDARFPARDAVRPR